MTAKERRDAVLLALLAGHEAVRTSHDGWRWSTKFESAPSLADPQVSALFRADYVTEIEGVMKLTAMGKIIAKRLT